MIGTQKLIGHMRVILTGEVSKVPIREIESISSILQDGDVIQINEDESIEVLRLTEVLRPTGYSDTDIQNYYS